MAAVATELGSFQDRLPYLRIGTGAAPLVVLPGLALTTTTPRGLTLAAYARGFRRLAQDHTLYVVPRPRGLRRGMSTGDLAAEYAAVLRPELGRFALMGMSTGGLIAQHLAVAEPAVDRLVLVVAGARIDRAGRAHCERWLELAARRRWRALHGDLAAIAVDGRVPQALARAVLALSGHAPTDEEAADFVTTVQADLAHDASQALRALRVPTLVVGGALDPFFPEPVLRATADAIPQAQLRVFPHNGHGVPKHRSGELLRAVAEFLAPGAT